MDIILILEVTLKSRGLLCPCVEAAGDFCQPATKFGQHELVGVGVPNDMRICRG